MKQKITDGTDPDFISLCKALDTILDEIVGGEKQRQEYRQYNTLEAIQDVIVLYEGKQPVACGSFKRYEPGVAEIKRIFVRAAYREQGLGKQVMAALEQQAKRQGYETLILETGEPLVAAMQLYEKMGYTIIPNYGPYENMPDSICMKKQLIK